MKLTLTLLTALLLANANVPAQHAGATAISSGDGKITISTSIVTNGVPFGTTFTTNITDGNVSVFIQSSGSQGAVIASAAATAAPVTWLGVSADEVSADLRAQLPLDEGVGLIVRHVAPDSPAAKAGIQENDILTKLDDQTLVNPPQLRQLVVSKKDGTTVTLAGLRKGKAIQFTAKLAQKERGPEDVTGQVIDLGGFNIDLNKMLGELKANGAPIVIGPGANTFTFGTNITHSFSFSTNITGGATSGHIIIKQGTTVNPSTPKP